MRVRAQTAGLEPIVEIDDVRSLVVYDDFQNPILIVQKFKPGQVLVYKPGDPDFAKALKVLGIGLNANYTVVK